MSSESRPSNASRRSVISLALGFPVWTASVSTRKRTGFSTGVAAKRNKTSTQNATSWKGKSQRRASSTLSRWPSTSKFSRVQWAVTAFGWWKSKVSIGRVRKAVSAPSRSWQGTSPDPTNGWRATAKSRRDTRSSMHNPPEAGNGRNKRRSASPITVEASIWQPNAARSGMNSWVDPSWCWMRESMCVLPWPARGARRRMQRPGFSVGTERIS